MPRVTAPCTAKCPDIRSLMLALHFPMIGTHWRIIVSIPAIRISVVRLAQVAVSYLFSLRTHWLRLAPKPYKATRFFGLFASKTVASGQLIVVSSLYNTAQMCSRCLYWYEFEVMCERFSLTISTFLKLLSRVVESSSKLKVSERQS